MLYLADFSLAILAAFGIETLLSEGREALWPNLNRGLAGLVIVSGLCLLVPSILGKPEIDPWVALSIILIFASYALLQYVARCNSGASAKFLIVALSPVRPGLVRLDRTQPDLGRQDGRQSAGQKYELAGGRQFSEVPARRFPRAGSRRSATQYWRPIRCAECFRRWRDHAIRFYADHRESRPAECPLFGEASLGVGAWAGVPGCGLESLYENPTALPWAWIVHESVIDESKAKELPPFDPTQTALMNQPLKVKLDPSVGGNPETVAVSSLANNQVGLRVRAQSRGLLVLSETYYPGWHASVNGAAEDIYQVDGDLRGVVVPAGNSQVILKYIPASIYVGGSLSFLAFTATLFFWVKRRRSNP